MGMETGTVTRNRTGIIGNNGLWSLFLYILVMDLLNHNPQSAEHCANKPGIIRSNLTEGNFFAARKTLAILDNIVNFVLIAKNSTVQ